MEEDHERMFAVFIAFRQEAEVVKGFLAAGIESFLRFGGGGEGDQRGKPEREDSHGMKSNAFPWNSKRQVHGERRIDGTKKRLPAKEAAP
jgi:hypothetical protein